VAEKLSDEGVVFTSQAWDRLPAGEQRWPRGKREVL